MGSKVISFRFDDDKLALLQQHQIESESESQAAMRLLLGVLGVEGKKPSIQSVDIVDSIRTEIKESIADGDIAGAIANSYTAMMGQFNGLLGELQELKSNLATLKQPATNNEQPKIKLTHSQYNSIQKTLSKPLGRRLERPAILAAFMARGYDGLNYLLVKEEVVYDLIEKYSG